MKNKSLTEGNITRQLVTFAVPLLIGALIQQLYSTVDMMFVGNVLGTEAAAAIGSSGMIVNCIVAFFTGLSVGVGVIVGKTMGSGDEKRLSRVIHCAAGLTIIMGLVFMIGGLLLSPALLQLMNTPTELFAQALKYIRLYMCSVFAIVSYNVGTGIIKALGNSRTPTIYQLIGGIINVIGNYLFIVVFHWGIVGAALTTLLSQLIAAGLTVSMLFRLPDTYRLRIRKIRLEKFLCMEILSIGIPSAIQSIMISVSNMMVQTNINKLDVTSMASFTAYYKVELLVYYPIMAVGQACSAFVSQNVGAGHLDRAREGTKKSILLGIGVTVVLSALLVFGARTAFSLFSKDPNVIQLGSQIALVTFPFYFFYVFLEVFAASIRGAGKAVPTMIITIANMCVLRIILILLLMQIFHSAVGVAMVYPITWACNALSMFIYYRSKRWVPSTTKNLI